MNDNTPMDPEAVLAEPVFLLEPDAEAEVIAPVREHRPSGWRRLERSDEGMGRGLEL